MEIALTGIGLVPSEIEYGWFWGGQVLTQLDLL